MPEAHLAPCLPGEMLHKVQTDSIWTGNGHQPVVYQEVLVEIPVLMVTLAQ